MSLFPVEEKEKREENPLCLDEAVQATLLCLKE
jgi:hypothetical protein